VHAALDVIVQAARYWPAMHVGVVQELQEPVCAIVESDHVPPWHGVHNALAVVVQAARYWPALHVGVVHGLQVPVSAAALSDQSVPPMQEPHDVSAVSEQAIVYCPCTQLDVEQVQGEGVPPGQQFSPSQVYVWACTAAPARNASAAAARSAIGTAAGMAAWKGLQERKRARQALAG
jgi:hypothetical protein